jgi:hypothetical protein
MNGTATFGRKQRAGDRLRRSMAAHQGLSAPQSRTGAPQRPDALSTRCGPCSG